MRQGNITEYQSNSVSQTSGALDFSAWLVLWNSKALATQFN